MNETIINYYKWYIDNVSGDTSNPQIVGWVNKFSQYVRFKILLNVGVENNDKILDYGCGVGDLIKYVKEANLDIDYTGMDINPAFIEIAKKNHPGYKFILSDYNNINDNYDWILASGVFTIAFSLEEVVNAVDILLQKSVKGIAFNLLLEKDEIRFSSFNSYDPNKILEIFQSLYPNVSLITDYTDDDFTIYILK